MKRFLYSRALKRIMYIFFGLFYDRQFLKGYYFDIKRAGWLWAWKGLKRRSKVARWPIGQTVTISGTKRISFDVNDLHIFQSPGCYYQVIDGNITIGKGTWVAPNVGFITTNHDVNNLSEHEKGKDIVIGDCCWIGMNAVILPGVTLGSHTIVGAGAVVTKSFPEGNCMIAGVPARVIKQINDNA